MKTNWLEHYQADYYNLLEGISERRCVKRGLVPGMLHRADGFQLMFEQLIKQNCDQYHIIETGTLRNPGNWKDGQSAVLFADFVAAHGGTLRSVDIDPTAVKAATEHFTTPNVEIVCSDSVAYLKSLNDLDKVDLFYLDSWDVKWNDDKGSAEHHLKEFLAIEPFLKSGCIVAIDDNAKFIEDNRRTGKGRAIVEYLAAKGIVPIYDAYQIIYKF